MTLSSSFPLEDANVDPWPRLKPAKFARGIWRPDGGFFAADPGSARMLKALETIRGGALRFVNSRNGCLRGRPASEQGG